MYNLTVAEAHTFYVGSGQWLVHNQTKTVNPFDIRFSHDSIKWEFKDGRTIGGLVDGLKSGTIKPEDVEPIRLVEKDGKLYTLDNRRLEAFRRAGVEVPYRLATPEEAAKEGWKFTTKTDGLSIRVKGEPCP